MCYCCHGCEVYASNQRVESFEELVARTDYSRADVVSVCDVVSELIVHPDQIHFDPDEVRT